MTDAEIMDKAMAAEETYRACIRKFRIHPREGAGVRVVEYPSDPDRPLEEEAMPAEDSVKVWDLGSKEMAQDFIRLQGWKAVVQQMTAVPPVT